MGILGVIWGITKLCYPVNMFKINDDKIKQFEADLDRMNHKAIPFATRNTVNTSAFRAQAIAREGVKSDMTLRNRFTVQSIQVEQTRSLHITRQAATVGSTAGYMEDQEFGSIKTKKGKEGVPIATSYSAGQGQGVQPRTRLPRKGNKLASIQLRKRQKGKGSRKSVNAAIIKGAAASGHKFVFLDLGRTKGIFRVVGSKRKPKIRMVHDMSRTSVVIPRNPWLSPAVDKTRPLVPEIYRDSLLFQLKRLKTFR